MANIDKLNKLRAALDYLKRTSGKTGIKTKRSSQKPRKHEAEPSVIVRCPASSANLGPGFDRVALALSYPSDLLMLKRTRGHVW